MLGHTQNKKFHNRHALTHTHAQPRTCTQIRTPNVGGRAERKNAKVKKLKKGCGQLKVKVFQETTLGKILKISIIDRKAL